MKAALALVCLLAGPATAQVDPSGSWRTLHTAHFLIHFRPATRAAAEHEAREAERAYALLSRELHPPRGVVDLVLGDDIDAANGFATMFPSNRLTVFAAPPTTDPGLEHFDDWLRLVTTHELTHVFHLDRTKGWWRVVQSVFGRVPGTFPNAYQPSWVAEGLATYYESRLTGGGRVTGSFHTQVLLADAAGGRPRTPWNAVFFTRWPDGYAPYAYGSRFFERLSEAAGDSAIPRFIERTSGQLIPYRVGRQVRRASGRDLQTEWRAGPARAAAICVEDDVGPAELRRELRPHLYGRKHRAAREASRLRTRHRTAGHIFLRLRLEDLELDARRRARGPNDSVLQSPPAVRLLAQPERAH